MGLGFFASPISVTKRVRESGFFLRRLGVGDSLYFRIDLTDCGVGMMSQVFVLVALIFFDSFGEILQHSCEIGRR